MEKVPPLDQKSIPICYAFSAAELLQTWRCSHGAPDCESRWVSPVSIAVNAELLEINRGTAKVSGPGSQGTAFWGYSRDQIQAADLFRGPYCDQNAIGSLDQDSAMNRDINEQFALYKKRCIQMVPLFGGTQSAESSIDQASCRMLDGQPLSHDSFKAFALSFQKCLAEDGLHDGSGVPIDVKQIETALTSSNPFLLVQGEIQDSCRQNTLQVPPMPALDFYSIKPDQGEEPDPAKTSKARQAIAAEFDKMGNRGQPVFVTYCGDVLAGGRRFLPAYGSNCSGAHASLIIGRRKNPKTQACQYLVRNSWGKTCNNDSSNRYHYSPDWDCEKDKGDYWIDQDTLMSATLEVGGVENEGIGGLIPAAYMSSHSASTSK